MTTSDAGDLLMFTIYHEPRNFPGDVYVVRPWAIVASREPVEQPLLGTARTLEAARELVPPNSDTRVLRQVEDPRNVVETWF